MKTKLITENGDKKFKPFTIEITCESIQEARLMMHLSAIMDLESIIKKDTYWEDSKTYNYSNDFASEIGGSELYMEIESLVNAQGFKI